MATDLFNNISNDYIYPDLPPCSNVGDPGNTKFEFLPGQQAGIVSGSNILSVISLNDISQVVTGWVQQTKYLQSGELIFIQGLTKGLSNKIQVYPIDGSVAYDRNGVNSVLDQYYMSLDISIGYYNNFKYYEKSLFVTADEILGIDIASAINIAFGQNNIGVTATYDPSSFTFSGDIAGYEFNVSAIDASVWVPDTSIVGNSLYEDVTSRIVSSKYPNTAMLGYLLKVTYPSSANDYDYIKINHVPDDLIYFEPSTGDLSCYVRYHKNVDVGMNGASTDTTMSAGDYLSYVEENEKWDKVGVVRVWFTSQDPENSSVENLITGFYVYNPNIFTVKLDYMVMI